MSMMSIDEGGVVIEKPYTVERLDAAECDRLLESVEVGRLAVSVGQYPDIFPLNFSFRAGSVFFATAEGTKLAAVFTNRHVAFEVDGFDTDSGKAWSVVLKGVLREVEAFDIADASQLLEVFPWSDTPKTRILSITAEEISGRRFQVMRHRPNTAPGV